MGTCGGLDVVLLLLLGATFQTYALNCHKGIMLKFGYDFSEKYVNWSTSDIQLCSDGEVCQETLLLVDIDYATPGNMKCPVCLEFSGSCSRNKVVFCPKGTSHCYEGDFELDGGGLSATFSLEGCVASASKTLLGNSKTIGIFSVVEEGSRNTNPMSSQPSVGAHMPFLAWALGLRLSLALCPRC